VVGVNAGDFGDKTAGSVVSRLLSLQLLKTVAIASAVVSAGALVSVSEIAGLAVFSAFLP